MIDDLNAFRDKVKALEDKPLPTRAGNSSFTIVLTETSVQIWSAGRDRSLKRPTYSYNVETLKAAHDAIADGHPATTKTLVENGILSSKEKTYTYLWPIIAALRS